MGHAAFAASQSHSGGFVGGGQRGQKHLDGGTTTACGVAGIGEHTGQSHVGGGHSGQWQTIPGLPHVLAAGVSGQWQSHLGGGSAGHDAETIITQIPIIEAKITKDFILVFSLFSDFTQGFLSKVRLN